MSWPLPGFFAADPIPADQPLTVYRRAGRRALFVAAITALPLTVLGAVAGPVFAVLLRQDVAAFAVGGTLCLGVAGLLLTGLQMLGETRRGPMFAVGPGGLWIRTRPYRSRGIWVPWEAVARIYPRTWFGEKFLCVQTWNPELGQEAGGIGRFDTRASRKVFGTGLLLPVWYADRSATEIVSAVRHFAAGRVPVE